MNLDKSLKLAKKLLKFIKVIIVINFIVAIAIFFFSLDADFMDFASNATSVTLGVFKIYFRDSVPDTFINNNMLTFASVLVAVIIILWYLIARQLEIIIDNALDGHIFCQTSTKSLNLIALFVMIEGLINIITGFIGNSTIYKHISSLELFNNEIVESVTVNSKFDISFLAISFVIFILAKVFAYGQQLQKLSDETL